MRKEDFADALSRMSSNFKAQHSHGKVFLPEAFVVSEEVDGQAKGKRDVDEQKNQDKQEFDQVQKAVTEQIDVDEQIRRLEEIEQVRRKLNKPQQRAQQNAPASVNDLIPTSTFPILPCLLPLSLTHGQFHPSSWIHHILLVAL